MGPSSDGGTLRNMVSFIVLAGIAATAVACTLAVSLFLLTGWTMDFWLPWRQRVLADGLAVITITPLILLTCAGQLVGAQPKLGRSYAELGLLTIGLLAVGIPVLGWESQGPANRCYSWHLCPSCCGQAFASAPGA